MKAYLEPLDRLKESVRWFVAVRELRLLHVHTSQDFWLASLEKIQAAQLSPHNRSPFVFIGTPVEAGDPGWLARIGEFEENFAALQADAAKADPPVPLPSLRFRSGNTALEQFAARLRAAAEGMPSPYKGLIVVLAPTVVADPGTWLRDLRLLMNSPALGNVRWILQESGDGPGSALATELGPFAERAQVFVEDKRSQATLAAMVAGMKTAPMGADSQRLAGMAGPRVAPPPRANHRPPDPEAQKAALLAAGVNPALGDVALMHQLRIAVLDAALAFREGRLNDAAQSQTRARDICAAAGLVKESSLMELVLGAYVLQAGAPDYALQIFEAGIQRAEQAGTPLPQVQGHLARGGTLLSVQRPWQAAQAYARAGELAEQHQLGVFAIESYRMVGHILLQQKQEQQAAAAWLRAVNVATEIPNQDRAGSSALVTARELAGIYRRAGVIPQAVALEEQAQHWELEAAVAALPKPAPTEDGAA
jgi:hypothetical protein